MKQINKVRVCLVLNFFLLLAICIVIFTCASSSPYFKLGPNDDFVIVSVRINTNQRYAILLLFIAISNFIKVLVSELGEPVLVFNVYNPDKRVITEFTKFQLLTYANMMFFVSNTRRVFEVLVTVTQFDIAIFSIIIEQIASIGTVCLLVKEKRFDNVLIKDSEAV